MDRASWERTATGAPADLHGTPGCPRGSDPDSDKAVAACGPANVERTWRTTIDAMSPRSPTFARFLLLFAFLYAAFGVNSPFFPAFLSSRGLEAGEIAVVLASGTAVRLVAAPLAGRIADAFDAARASLVVSIGASAVSTLAYVLATGFSPLLLVSVLSAVALGPVAPLADTGALAAAEQRGSGGRRAFEYGWARGAGSAAFIAGTLISGHAVERFGLVIIVILQASL